MCLLLGAGSLARAGEGGGGGRDAGATVRARSAEVGGTATASAPRTFARFFEERIQPRLLGWLFDLNGLGVPPVFLPNVVSDDPDPTGAKAGGNHSRDQQERAQDDPDASNAENEQAARGMTQGGP
jgi:hypothetical protein